VPRIDDDDLDGIEIRMDIERMALTAEQQAYFDEEERDSHELTAFAITGPYQLRLTFDDGTVKVIDFKESLFSGAYKGELYTPLRDLAYFEQVYIDASGTLSWPNGLDFSPPELYRWPTATVTAVLREHLDQIVPVRFTKAQLAQLKEIARRKGLAPSTLLRSWALEQMAGAHLADKVMK
jgi:hypothetical protein